MSAIIEVTPDASIDEAILKARSLEGRDVQILIREGTYYLTSPIVLGPEDSGLHIIGEGAVTLVGGEVVQNWRQINSSEWRAQHPEFQNGQWDFRTLSIHDRFADRARYPETGYLVHKSEFDVKWKSTVEGGFEREPSLRELTTLHYQPSDIPDTFVPENAELTIFHMWDESLVGIKSIDRPQNTLHFSNSSGWPPGAFADHYQFEKRYVIWNTREGFLKPGQWYLDREHGELVYWPMKGDSIESLQSIAPRLENILILQGEKNNPVTDITLENLKFSGTNAPLISGAFGAKRFDGAVSLRNTEGCRLLNLEISNVGGHAIKAEGDELTISGCNLHDCGAGAIRFIGSRSNICNNSIHHIGKTFPSAIALYVGVTDPNEPDEWLPTESTYFDNTIEHNEIHDVPYAAICAGGRNLRILKNLIYRAMQDLYDGAGIYITFCENALVKHNFIRDIKNAPGAGTSAYYLDELTVGAVVEENLEINVPRPSHNHISKGNLFRNNFFIIDGRGFFSIERSEAYRFEKNVIVAKGGFDFYDLQFCESFKNNIIYTPGQKPGTKDLDHYTVLREYELELTDGNLNVDPQLVNYENGDVCLSPDSPALKLGIQPIDVSDAGLIGKTGPTI